MKMIDISFESHRMRVGIRINILSCTIIWHSEFSCYREAEGPDGGISDVDLGLGVEVGVGVTLELGF